MLIVILITSLAFVFGLLLGGSSVVLIFRKVFQDNSFQMNEYELAITLRKEEVEQQRKLIEEQKQAVQELIYNYHHRDLNPKCKRLRGAIGVSRHITKNIRDYLKLMSIPKNNNHYRYAELSLKEMDELEVWANVQDKICIEMEEEIINTANKFDHLQ
jgi:AMMECR1 domain-containing protein